MIRNFSSSVYFISLISALGGLLFGYDTGVISGAILFIRKDFNLGNFQTELVVSAILIGAVIGACFAGELADKFGRKKMIILAAILFIAGALISAFAPNEITLILGRVLLGIAIGGASMMVPLYIAEIAPPSIRGFLVSLNQVMVTAGILASYLVNLYFAKAEEWRMMLGIAVIPALLLGVGMLLLPESPRWLVKWGFKDQAKRILNRLHSPAVADQELRAIEGSLDKKMSLTDFLANKAYRVPLIVGIGLAIFQQITGINTIIYYAPMIFEMTGLSSNVTAILATAGVGLVNFLMTLVAIKFIDKIGRRPLLIIGLIGMAIALGLIGFAFKFIQPSPRLGWITGLSLTLYIASFAISLGPIFWLLIAEIYPLSVRGRAMSLATIVNWASNLAVGITFLTLIHRLGNANTFWFYGLVTIACLIFTYYFVPETKGKTLEEIEMSWRRRKV